MNAITENPYRILGLLGNATEREIQKQIATINRNVEVGNTIHFEFDFPFLGDFKRDELTVAAATNKIEQPTDKVNYSLFWFLNSNHIDDVALDHLKKSSISIPTEIWEKLIKESTITVKNYSAALNLSTLQLGIATRNALFDPILVRKSIQLKGRIISSDAFLNFIQTVVGYNTSVNEERISEVFVEEILKILEPYLNKSNGITSVQLINAFSSFPTKTKQYIVAKFTAQPLNDIKKEVENAKQKRIKKVSASKEYGVALFRNTKDNLTFLKQVLGSTNINYQLLVNNVANEILECAISFYNENQVSDEYNSGLESLKLMAMATNVFPSGLIKTRVDNNIIIIQSNLEQVRVSASSTRTTSSNSDSDCFIATMAYGSYEHPQVLQLRKFRDETLTTSAFGRKFITTYYKISPKIVVLLRNKPMINSTIKTLLNIFIKIIK